MTNQQTRTETLAKIKSMVTEGKSLKEAISANGITVGSYYRWKAMGGRKAAKTARKRAYKATQRPDTLNGDFFQFVLTNPKFNDAQRVKVLLAYTQA